MDRLPKENSKCSRQIQPKFGEEGVRLLFQVFINTKSYIYILRSITSSAHIILGAKELSFTLRALHIK